MVHANTTLKGYKKNSIQSPTAHMYICIEKFNMIGSAVLEEHCDSKWCKR